MPDRAGSGLAGGVTQVLRVDPGDDAALRGWWEAQTEAMRADHEYAATRTWSHLRESVRHPWAYYSRHLLSAVAGDDVVGTAEIGRDAQDNTHLADLTVAVRPAYRRRGIGRALYAAARQCLLEQGVTTVIGEAYTTPTWSGAVDFAEALGFESVHIERHLRLSLPLDADHLVALREAAGDDDDYTVLTWTDRCPDEHVDAFARLQTQMLADVPLGDIDYAPPEVDVDRVRTLEEHMLRTHGHVVAAARRPDGSLAGYSMVFLDCEDDLVVQDDTLVMPEDRGHRLGLRLKLATLEVVQRDHPERTAIHTWTALDNQPMQRTNTAFGFEPVAVMHEMQRRLEEAG